MLPTRLPFDDRREGWKLRRAGCHIEETVATISGLGENKHDVIIFRNLGRSIERRQSALVARLDSEMYGETLT